MFPNTAICAGLSGLGLLLLPRSGARGFRQGVIRILAVSVAFIGGLSLFQHISGVNLGIDTLLFDPLKRPWGQRAAASPMRMGPPASISFLILGAAMYLATAGPRARRFASALATLPVAIASLSLIGYWFGSDQLYTIVHLTGIAFQTSTVVAALGVGMLASIPEHGLVALVSRDDAGGMLVRRLLLPIIVLPLVVGWLRLLGQQAGYYDTAFGVAMVLLTTIGMLLGLLTWTALGISRAAEASRQSQSELEEVLRRDIADRKQAETVLREREQRYELVLLGAEAAIWDWDVPNRRVMYSPRWKQLRGFSDDELTDSENEWSTRIHPEDYDRVMAAVQAHFEGRTAIFHEEYRVRRKDGHWVWILDRGIARRDESGQVVRMAGSETDITEQKRAENELRQAEERMRSVVDHVVDGIITIDEHGAIESFNPAAEKLFGYRRGEVIGRNVKHLMPEPFHSQHDDYLQSYLTTGQAKIIGIGREVVGRRNDGSTFPMELAVSTFQIGSQRFFTGIVRDVTDRKQLEDELRLRVEELAERDQRKNEFLATLAHELRNPLAPIRNALQILRMSPPGSDTGPLQDIMERQVNHMVRLVDDLLEVSRITSGKIELRPEPVDLAGVLHSAVETSKPLMEACGHRFTLSLPAEPLPVVADPVRLSQVVANLLNNAAKYTEPGGKIWLSACRNNGDVAISVRDTGMGISPAMLPQLFRMFAQSDRDHKRAQGGLGIGLALAKSLVEMQGGWIEARSEGEGCGAEFVVHLPLREAGPATRLQGLATDRPPEAVSAGSRVLVVDDNHDAAGSLAILLRIMGNDVRTAGDGPAALAAIASFQPSVVLLDLGMPGMSGYEVAERIQNLPAGKQCVLVALTGWGQEEDRRRTQEAGFKYHLVKPVEFETIQSLLTELRALTPSRSGREDSCATA
jgi:PAS domain S-box-containing protein